MSAGDVQTVFRALAEVRDKQFYGLWSHLTDKWPKPLPQIGFRVYQVSETPDACVVVSVAAFRPDGEEVTWSVSVRASAALLTVAAAIETDDEELYSSIYETADALEAADLIRMVAAEVCRRDRP